MVRGMVKIELINKPKVGLIPIPAAFPQRNTLSISKRLCTTRAFPNHNNHLLIYKS